MRPVEELRAEALDASPPPETGSFRESELVEVTSLEPGIRLDVRYATTNNFMSSVFYDEPRVFLQRPAAEAVARAHRALAARGYGLLLHDGYRPWYVTKMFWDATPEAEGFLVYEAEWWHFDHEDWRSYAIRNATFDELSR
ncbi:M15 family metallopeptidase [Candidatus Palauibacter sp.]|uniref:M15 family metallopeptidase n=1 Tax=Candidatus Palauibacter sp. TaxID=3101350 RepID=UPI003B5B607D